MKLDRTFLFSLVAALCLAKTATAQTSSSYRERYPLPASSSVTSWAVNVDFDGKLPADAEVQAIADSGAKLVRLDLAWARVEQIAGTYKFTYYDDLLNLLNSKGLRTIFILDYNNKLYNGGYSPNTDESRAAFVAFTKAAVQRYQGQGVIWEIWNEPNEDKFWRPIANVDDYSTLALLVGQAIREVAPEEWVVGPGLSGFDWPFLEACFRKGILQFVDAVSVHPYRSDAIPETALPDYERLKAMIDLYRPAGKSVAILDSEWGYSLGWVQFDSRTHAKLHLRTKLVDMVAGARISVSYAWRDAGVDPSNNHHWFGFNDFSLVEREAGRAFRQFTSALKGYRLIARLDVGSPNDYCLLFSCGAATKLVAWTTDDAHDVALPASAGSFEGLDFGGGLFTLQTYEPGAVVTLTDGPLILKPTTMNTLLRTASNWGRLPSVATVSDYAKLQKIISPLLVTSSWKYAPAGSLVKVFDSAHPDQLFAAPAFQGSVTGLNSVTMDAAPVQQILGGLPRANDLTDGARQMRVTLTTADGASATQLADLYHGRPLKLIVLTPQNGKLTVRVENPSGMPFLGQLKAQANGKSAVYDVSFAPEETVRTLYVNEITKSDMQKGLRMAVVPISPTTLDTFSSVGSATVLVSRLPDPVADAYVAQLEGDALVAGTASTLLAPAPAGGGITGMKSLRIDYSLGAGERRLAVIPPISISGVDCPGVARSLGMWVLGDGSKNTLKCRFADADGELFEATYGAISWLGWKFVQIPLDGSQAVGNSDGIVQGPVRIVSPAVIESQRALDSAGSIYLAGFTVLSTVPLGTPAGS